MNTRYLTKGISPRNKAGVGFKEGNPGKPVGAVSKTTLLKEKLLDAALRINLEGYEKRVTKKGKIYLVPIVSKEEILKLSAGFVPKEQKIIGEGFESTNITNILSGEQISSEERRDLIAALRARRSSEESVKPS